MVMTDSIPVAYLQTLVIIIDDDARFLNSIKSMLFRHRIASKAFRNPKEALGYFKSQYQSPAFLDQKFCPIDDENIDSNSPTNHAVCFDVSSLHLIPYMAERFLQPLVIIVDYNMPGMDGLELSNSLKELGLPIKTIMLTGEAGDDVGIDGFNANTIRKFVKKFEYSELADVIRQQWRDTFSDCFRLLEKALLVKGNGCLNLASFVTLFEKICAEKKIVEYYFWQEPGCFMLLSDSKVYFLVVLSGQQIQKDIDFLMDEEADDALIAPLQARQKALFFISDKERHASLDQWPSFLAPIQPLEGTDLFYGIVEDLCGRDVQSDNIVFYKQFLEENFKR